ncbi:MAG: DUF1232 domain-containing protein [Candidatus Cloacimonetes bacterium]|nr:DUF1232 domain-containing protein [Candidatus Cloacimonadota bacterium]
MSPQKKKVDPEKKTTKKAQQPQVVKTPKVVKKEEIIEEIIQDVPEEKFEEVKATIARDPGKKKLQFYEKLREKFASKIPQDGTLNRISDFLFLLPDFFILLCRLLMEDRVTNQTKAFILGVIAYVMLPIDIIPDFIPIVGFIDDLILVVFALDQILKHTDEQILIDNWSGKGDLLLTIRNVLDIADRAVSQRVLIKIKAFLHKIKIA